ncbi:tight junction-associated protein 1 [Lynx pardinus]|uniref:Tight junction-associated protein 1 n=1 Tax=Lynx pardinus TaxID=191816 RepID=A0A485PFE0_LYNPA|nr:tight junction-associated protein 1 [Lynx pardinus]
MTSAAPAKKPYRKAPPEHRELRLEVPGSRLEQEEPLTDAERMKLLQQENEELRRRLASATRRTEALERELEIGQDCLELELGQSREELDKFKDKFRRLQNSYTASQRTNQELEDKLHTLIKKAEMDRKTLDWEIVELTNKLLDAKNTINKLEELNERYRLDCNLAVQLLKCNKSHFRNHKFADFSHLPLSSCLDSSFLLCSALVCMAPLKPVNSATGRCSVCCQEIVTGTGGLALLVFLEQRQGERHSISGSHAGRWGWPGYQS